MSILKINETVYFDGKSTPWRVRAATKSGRYALLTCAMFGRVYYTIVDHEESVRGPMNISGQGLGIFTTKGKDEAIDTAIKMLDDSLAAKETYFLEHPENIGVVSYDGEWEVSSRNRVPLRITERHRISSPAATVTNPTTELDAARKE